jgi:UDP-N-acetylglucosamine 4-epimerase
MRLPCPNGAYAAVIPKYTLLIMNLDSATINGDGTNSRDFKYIDNVIQMNHLAASTLNKDAIGQVFNTAVGERVNLLDMTFLLKKYLTEYKQ